MCLCTIWRSALHNSRLGHYKIFDNFIQFHVVKITATHAGSHSVNYNCTIIIIIITIIIFSGSAAQRVLWPSRSRGFLIAHNDTPQSVGLLWMSDQLVAETSTWQHTTHPTDKHPCPRWDSNPRSHTYASDRAVIETGVTVLYFSLFWNFLQ
jgi:hypothetical protein